ncbi:MAG: NTP transferase domain-containing protein [Candidatus Nanopelagicales bacterium]
MTIQVAILAAGMGTRLGRPWPKPLTKLDDGRSIMGQQRDNISEVFGEQARVITVVGFKLESILEEFPDGLFVYNENFDTTNTSKSLLKALRMSGSGPVVWMNGDVVFDARGAAPFGVQHPARRQRDLREHRHGRRGRGEVHRRRVRPREGTE